MSTKEKTIICFDATELDNFEMCSQRWHLFHHLHLRPKSVESYFEKGILIHYLLEQYYKRKQTGGVDSEQIENIIEGGRIKSLEFNLSLEEVAEHIFQFREYVRYYAEENIIPLYVEEPFVKEIWQDEEMIVYISGRPDIIFKYPHTSGVSVMDHKRVQRETAISPLRNQFLLYAAAMETDTVIVNKIGFQKTKSAKERFQRTPFIYPKEIIEEWKQKTINRAREMIICQTHEYYERNHTSCEKWNGCFFQRYCTTRPSAREFLIGSEYILGEEWDVSKRLELKT